MPLFSWFSKPEEDKDDSLYITPSRGEETPGEIEFMESAWTDNRLYKAKLPPGVTTSAQYFADRNSKAVSTCYDAPVITFSHFLPNVDVLLATDEDERHVREERRLNGVTAPLPPLQGSSARINFTRYAGSKRLQRQIEQVHAQVHVFGHQHRNRDRKVGGVRFVSHCLGNPRDRVDGWTWGFNEWKGPKQIWPQAERKEGNLQCVNF